MKTSTRLLSVILVAMTLTIGLTSCDIQINDEGIDVSVLSSGLESHNWRSVTDYDDCTVTRILYFTPQGTGYFTEVTDYYDKDGQLKSSVQNTYNLSWKIDENSDMTIYLDDGSNIYFDNISIGNGQLYGLFDNENLSFE